MYIEGEVPTVTYGNGYNNNGFGNGWEGLIGLAIVASLFGGWGGNFGFGGSRGNAGFVGGDILGYELGKVASTNDVASGFNNSAVLNNLSTIRENQLSMQNFVNQGFSGINTSLLQGFHGVDNAVCTLGYNMNAGFNSVNNSIASCCCDIKGMLLENRYLNEKQTCDIVNAINMGNQRLVDIYTSDKIETLSRKLAVAEGQISQNAQTSVLLNAINRTPTPAYVVPNPYCCYNYSTCAFNGTANIQ